MGIVKGLRKHLVVLKERVYNMEKRNTEMSNNLRYLIGFISGTFFGLMIICIYGLIYGKF